MVWSLLSNGTQRAVSNGSILIKMPYFYLALFVGSPALTRHGYLVFRPRPVTNSPLQLCCTNPPLSPKALPSVFHDYKPATSDVSTLSESLRFWSPSESRETKFCLFFLLNTFSFVFQMDPGKTLLPFVHFLRIIS